MTELSRHLPLHRSPGALERFSSATTRWVGTSWAFITALVLTLAWAVSGPFFHYSDTWQLIMNTISSIITFLMVFLIQRSQNKHCQALQTKLDSLLTRCPRLELVDLENASESEVERVRAEVQRDVIRAGSACDLLEEPDHFSEHEPSRCRRPPSPLPPPPFRPRA